MVIHNYKYLAQNMFNILLFVYFYSKTRFDVNQDGQNSQNHTKENPKGPIETVVTEMKTIQKLF